MLLYESIIKEHVIFKKLDGNKKIWSQPLTLHKLFNFLSYRKENFLVITSKNTVFIYSYTDGIARRLAITITPRLLQHMNCQSHIHTFKSYVYSFICVFKGINHLTLTDCMTLWISFNTSFRVFRKSSWILAYTVSVWCYFSKLVCNIYHSGRESIYMICRLFIYFTFLMVG